MAAHSTSQRISGTTPVNRYEEGFQGRRRLYNTGQHEGPPERIGGVADPILCRRDLMRFIAVQTLPGRSKVFARVQEVIELAILSGDLRGRAEELVDEDDPVLNVLAADVWDTALDLGAGQDDAIRDNRAAGHNRV